MAESLLGSVSFLEVWILEKLLMATWETIYMVVVATLLSYLFGLPMGVLLVATSKGHIFEHSLINRYLGGIVNAARSVPFIIFLILLIPFTRLLMGTSIGTAASIVPLTIAAVPFVARMVETSLNEIDWGLIEAAISMGAGTWKIVTSVLLPESLPSLVSGVAITTINLVGYSAMAGIVGGGGLGTLAYYYGYQRYENSVMWMTVIVLIILVQGVQMLGDNISQKIFNNRR
ncbi:MAG: ABC transporter permease [Peptococcaceae bacterium]|nr:ABC transporter permease [Peptococcaceae bacterium]